MVLLHATLIVGQALREHESDRLAAGWLHTTTSAVLPLQLLMPTDPSSSNLHALNSHVPYRTLQMNSCSTQSVITPGTPLADPTLFTNSANFEITHIALDVLPLQAVFYLTQSFDTPAMPSA